MTANDSHDPNALLNAIVEVKDSPDTLRVVNRLNLSDSCVEATRPLDIQRFGELEEITANIPLRRE